MAATRQQYSTCAVCGRAVYTSGSDTGWYCATLRRTVHRECWQEVGEEFRAMVEGFWSTLEARRGIAPPAPEQLPPTVRPSRALLRYHGGKFRLAEWIISHFPPHQVYTEPFGGAASVLLRKPRVRGEVYNDLDLEVVGLFRILQDPSQSRELERRLRLTPFAREEFLTAYQPTEDPVETARRLLIRSFMGFGSAACNASHATGFRSNSNRSGTTPARDWQHWPEHLAAFTERLRGVVIESRPAVDVIRQHDFRTTLHYVDPPYPFCVRTGIRWTAEHDRYYRHELTDAGHRELAETLRSCAGMVVLSGYGCELYDRELYPDWERREKPTHADGARDRTEVLWLNPAVSRRLAMLGGLFAAEGAAA